jgi:hypothetical protein
MIERVNPLAWSGGFAAIIGGRRSPGVEPDDARWWL